MTNAANRTTVPDPVAVAVARAVQLAVAPYTVILFWARARGDHRPDSDIDLIIISETGSMPSPGLAKQAAREYFRHNPPQLGVDQYPDSWPDVKEKERLQAVCRHWGTFQREIDHQEGGREIF